MIRTILKNARWEQAQDATILDDAVARDLLDTLAANAAVCVGMAANMIGVNKRIIVFRDGLQNRLMMNPRIVEASEPYRVPEGCLSLEGERIANRFKQITVEWQDESMKRHSERFSGYAAQIIQHEIDHTNGIMI